MLKNVSLKPNNLKVACHFDLPQFPAICFWWKETCLLNRPKKGGKIKCAIALSLNFLVYINTVLWARLVRGRSSEGQGAESDCNENISTIEWYSVGPSVFAVPDSDDHPCPTCISRPQAWGKHNSAALKTVKSNYSTWYCDILKVYLPVHWWCGLSQTEYAHW